MAKATSSSRKRGNPKDSKRRVKKKVSPLGTTALEYLDYKDVDLLRRFMSDRAKIRNRRVSGNDVQQQRQVARAIKNAREMGLLPYTNRVTTQRGGNRRDGERGGRADGPAPRPSGPPPGAGAEGDELVDGQDFEAADDGAEVEAPETTEAE